MVDEGQVRHPNSLRIWKWAFGIGVGAVSAGAVVFAGVGRMAPPVGGAAPELASLSRPLEATGTASFGGTPLTTASVDLTTAIEIPPAATVLPPEKPLEKPKSAISKVFRVREPVTAGVTHFDSCLPSCETRDPQLVGLEHAEPEEPPLPPTTVPVPPAYIPSAGPVPPAPIPPVADALPPPLEGVGEPLPLPPRKGVVDLAVDGGKRLVDRVQGVSGAVVIGTKRALETAVDLVR